MNKERTKRILRALLAFSWEVISYIVELLATDLRVSQEDTEGYLVGAYNFRTSKLDNGTDPYGWYEEDL